MTSSCIDHGRKGNKAGYASCFYDGRYISLHVRTMIHHTGEQTRGRQVRHLCDNKRCINAEHLAWGSQADNVRDTIGKVGSKATSGKVLTDAEVIEVRSLRERTGATHQQLADRYGVGRVTITQILSGARR